MMKKLKSLLLPLVFLSSCTMFSSGDGQVVYHWERENTGVNKFVRDHNECLLNAKDFRWWPNFGALFFSEEHQLNVRADWDAEKGIWASYVPYPGAQPVIVNYLKNDGDASPRKYRICMEKKGYWHRTTNIPTVTNINLYNPRDRVYYAPSKLGYQ